MLAQTTATRSLRRLMAMSASPSPTPWTLKRLAWAYGCAGKGSTEESSLQEELERRLREPETQRIVTRLERALAEERRFTEALLDEGGFNTGRVEHLRKTAHEEPAPAKRAAHHPTRRTPNWGRE